MAETGGSEGDDAAASSSAGTIRVLLVERNESNAEPIVRALKRAGFSLEAVRVDTLSELETRLAIGPWDAVLCDYTPHALEPFGALELVHAHDPNIPFLVVSGPIGEEAAATAMRAGAHDCVLKTNLARLPAALTRELDAACHRRRVRRDELALLASERHYRNLFNATSVSLWELDLRGVQRYLTSLELGPGQRLEQLLERPEVLRQCAAAGRILDVNRATLHLLELTCSDDLVGPADRLLDLGLEELWRALALAMVIGEERVELETSARNRNGAQIRVRATLNLPDDPGHLENVALSIDDMTAHFQLEQEMRAAQRMEAVGKLAGSVAHDFNNILTVIRGYTELMRSQLAGSALDDLGEIEAAAARASKLTGQLLAFGRRQAMQLQPINLNDALTEVRAMLTRLLGENIDLHTHLADDLHLVHADRLQLSQVLMNLVVNAREAMPGGGKLTIETANRQLRGMSSPPLTNATVKDGDFVMLAVTDTGCGMDESTRRQIFEPFFTTKPVGRGTGLGLSTVYGIVRQSGGFIWVYSEVGHGTTMKVYLPRAQAEAPALVSASMRPPARGGSETILLVEDDVHVRTATRRLLQEQGYRVLEAGNGYEGLRVARRYHGQIDLLISDLVMPKMGGVELVQQLDSPRTRVLLMSGYPDGALQHQGLVGSDVSYVEKPFSPRGLLHRVRETLDRGPSARLEDAG